MVIMFIHNFILGCYFFLDSLKSLRCGVDVNYNGTSVKKRLAYITDNEIMNKIP